ncbi:MAG: DNA polymerase III subunit alpha [Holosporaceae bacterium]|jgi:DNA polymerase-3 subunit alpha|nr:DNA polymerase III subunit alpha [Holosporaceae bacterium]
MTNGFIHLRVHSAYSLAEGAIKIDKLVSLCEKHCMPAVAVTDTNNLFGAMDFSLNCAKRGIQPIIACQLNVQHPKKRDYPTSILLYAKNSNGYQNLIQLVSHAYLYSSADTYPEISLDMLSRYSNDIIAATGGVYGSLGAFLLEDDLDGALEYLLFLQRCFSDRLYVELSRHNNPLEERIEESAIKLAYDQNIPLLATNNVSFPTADYFNAHDVLICIAQGKTIYDGDRSTSSPEFYFKSPEEMSELFADLPEALENTVVLAQRCSFCLSKKKTAMPQFKILDGKNQDETLRERSMAGLATRLKSFESNENFDDTKQKYFARLQYELDMIKKMGFSGYFLIVADYVQWAKSKNIPVGPGRGSGAGSIVAWSIEITDVDPIRFKLFFERFLNPDRISMPDFDVDFCQERRDEVIDYVQKKYGEKYVAQIITFGKLQARAVVKDAGRVLAMPYGFMDKISKMIPFHPSNPVTLQQAIDSEEALRTLMESDPQVKNMLGIALKLEGLYRHASVHAAGVVISDKNLLNIVPLYKDSKATMPATQFSMKYIEDAGLIKFDFLGLKTLTVIQKILDTLKKRGISFEAQEIPLDDRKTFELLRSVNCVGVFQIESVGMKDVLRKLQPDHVEDLIALVALYRPGPMDDIPKYIACKHGIEPIKYLHEKLEPILAETYGVMVYQEQVMQIAQEIGGYTLGQADILRRAMGKKDKNEMIAQKKRFIDGAVARGVSMSVAENLFEQMSKFAGYGFNKSHSTPYGLLTYQTAFLKANYPLEFYSAAMTLDSASVDKLYAYCNDAKKNNITVLPPDINLSANDFIVDYETNSIRYSLTAIKGSGENAVRDVVSERERNGSYLSVFDFVERLLPFKIITRRTMENFIKAGAFDRLHPNRNQLFSSLDRIMSIKVEEEQALLFEKNYPELVKVPEWGDNIKMQNEFAAVGFYVSSHPLQQYENQLKKLGFPTIAEAMDMQKSTVAVAISGVIHKTAKNQTKFCILQVSDMSGIAEVTLFSETLASCRDLLEVGNIVILDVVCQRNEEVVKMTADKVQKFEDAYNRNTTITNQAAAPTTVAPAKKKRECVDGIQIKISSVAQLSAVKILLDNFKIGGNVKMEIIVDDKKIFLPDNYYVTVYDVLDLKNAVGVDNVVVKYVELD